MKPIAPHVVSLDKFELDIVFGRGTQQPQYQEDLGELLRAVDSREAEARARLVALQEIQLSPIAKFGTWLNPEPTILQLTGAEVLCLRSIKKALNEHLTAPE